MAVFCSVLWGVRSPQKLSSVPLTPSSPSHTLGVLLPNRQRTWVPARKPGEGPACRGGGGGWHGAF